MIYTQLSNNYKYDLLAESIYGREVEYFHYDFDLINFNQMLTTMEEGAEKDQIRKRIQETQTQMAIVKNIYDALISQIDDQTAYAAAVERASQKRNSAQA